MNASPAAQAEANTSAPLTGSVAQIAPASGAFSAPRSAPNRPKKASGSAPKSATKSSRNGSLPIRRANGSKRKASVINPDPPLSVAETTYKGKKAWRVSLGKRGKNLLSFRIRPSGSGFFVAWRSRNSERYVCYLSAIEWQTAEKGSAASFARMIDAKLDARRAAGEDLAKLVGLQDRVKAFA